MIGAHFKRPKCQARDPWDAPLGVSASTVSEWLALLEEMWILRRVPAFSAGRRREITSAARIHFYDMGIRNALLGRLEPDLDRRPDRDDLAKGWSFGELAKAVSPCWTIHYWRTKGGATIDFVLVNGEGVIGVEINADRRLCLSRSMRSFMAAYRPKAVILATAERSETREEMAHGTHIVWTPLHAMGRVAQDLTTSVGSD